VYIHGTRVDATSYADATARILAWAGERRGRYVCCANVHMVMAAGADEAFRATVNGASLVTPDGMPLVWLLRLFGCAQARVYGPDLMLHVCGAAARKGIPVGLHGGHPEALERLAGSLQARFPDIRIAHLEAPPFRALEAGEAAAEVDRIRASGARIVFVGLGCPKQERWLAANVGAIDGVLIGVGAAFDFHSRRVRQAPAWMQRHGLEWLFRLGMEPRRLARRYLVTNAAFLWRLPVFLLDVRRQAQRARCRIEYSVRRKNVAGPTPPTGRASGEG
jgi:N-acetylglucosaminyldiphosphoundecaprenol N-acetyl-beta-D-mannosaminyltransferase